MTQPIIAYWFQALADFDANVVGFGYKEANTSRLISNTTVSSIVILISVTVIGIVCLIINSAISTM